MDTIGHNQLGAAMPASSIEHQQDPLGRASADRLGEVRQSKREHLGSHRGQEEPFRLSRSRMHETVEVEPLVSVMHAHTRARTFPYPDSSQDWFEANAVLIGGPQFDRGLREGLLHDS